MEINDFIARLDSPMETTVGIASRCPNHDDNVRSLMTNPGEYGGVVVFCHAGCRTEDVLAKMGLSISDIMGAPRIIAEYAYADEKNRLLYTVQRWVNPKTFRVSPALPAPADRVLYNMAAIAWARENNAPVFVVEGEKDVDTLSALMVPATTNVGGAGKWLPHYNAFLHGLHVVVVADNDKPGKAHARYVARSLQGFAASVTLMSSPVGKDITDLIQSGYTLDALQLLPEDDGVGLFVASSVRERAVDWAWEGHFPFGKLSLIEGDPGDGKSVMTIDLAARWSTGRQMPDGSGGGEPMNVLMISDEDDLDDTIVPRLRLAGADMSRVFLIAYGANPEQPFDMVGDRDALLAFVKAKNIRIVILDPMSAFVPEATDNKADHSIRKTLQPIRYLARVANVALIAVRHLTKGTVGGKAMYRGSGGMAYIGAARAAFLVSPTHADPAVKALACVKANLSAKPPALTYRVEIDENRLPYVEWGEPLSITAQELLDAAPKPVDEEDETERAGKRRARAEEREFLYGILEDGPLSWDKIVELGKAEGYSDRTLRRARTELTSIESVRRDTQEGDGPKIKQTVWQRRQTFVTPSDETDATWPVGHLATGLVTGNARQNAENGGQVAVDGDSPSTLEINNGSTTDSDGNPGQNPLGHPESVPSLQTVVWPSGQVGQVADPTSPSVVDDAARDEALAGRPLVCEVCQSTGPDVTRLGKPFWTVRCAEDHPTLRGEDL